MLCWGFSDRVSTQGLIYGYLNRVNSMGFGVGDICLGYGYGICCWGLVV